MEAINIGTRREVFWDDFIVDTEKTTADLRLGHPEKKEIVAVLNMPWEGDGMSYPHVVKVDGIYRMYFITTISDLSKMVSKDGIHEEIVHTLSCIESEDGIRWHRPNLRNCKWVDTEENNIVIKDWLDNFYVFRDENPDCPEDEKYKGLAAREFGKDEQGKMYSRLWSYVSADGIHFKMVGRIIETGQFDTLNTAHWNAEHKKYMCFYRRIIDGVRMVYYAESTDFKNWSVEKPLTYSDGFNFPLYTNSVSPYYRAPHILSGFPTRYVERTQWTENYERLPGVESRKERMKIQPRYGLTTTDALFMTSRDGMNWHRFPEAFLTPGQERSNNWSYGDCYLSCGDSVETENEDGNREISMYCGEGGWTKSPISLRRYTIRLDGFASRYGKYDDGQRVVTKPIIFDGSKLEMNFKTSAMGSVYVNILDEDGNVISGFKGIEHFGDNTACPVCFETGYDVSSLSGKTVRLEFILKDAHIYSFQFYK